jgi:small GTP-binding protein
MSVIQKKICMLGDFAVGKTSTVRRYVEGLFDDSYLSTIGVKISRKPVHVGSQALHLIIWDLAGGDKFVHTNSGYLRGAAGALLVCDLTRPETLTTAERYSAEIRAFNPNAALILVGNKVDLSKQRQLSDTDLTMAAQRINCLLLTTSAKTGTNVELAFAQLARLITDVSL